MRSHLLLPVLAVGLGLAAPAFAEDSTANSTPGESLAYSAKAIGTGVRVTTAVVAVPIRIVAEGAGAVLKQTFTGLSEGSRADPFAGTALAVDNDVVVKPQPAPVVPRQVPAR